MLKVINSEEVDMMHPAVFLRIRLSEAINTLLCSMPDEEYEDIKKRNLDVIEVADPKELEFVMDCVYQLMEHHDILTLSQLQMLIYVFELPIELSFEVFPYEIDDSSNRSSDEVDSES